MGEWEWDFAARFPWGEGPPNTHTHTPPTPPPSDITLMKPYIFPPRIFLYDSIYCTYQMALSEERMTRDSKHAERRFDVFVGIFSKQTVAFLSWQNHLESTFFRSSGFDIDGSERNADLFMSLNVCQRVGNLHVHPSLYLSLSVSFSPPLTPLV